MMAPDILIIPDFLDDHLHLITRLVSDISWDDSMSARRTASFGKPYDYSQMTYETTEMHPLLVNLNRKLVERMQIPFNNCLLNYYQTGKITMGFHSDDTTHLIPETGVAIISLGSTRAISYRAIEDHSIIHHFDLNSGSLLYMDDQVQQKWQHAIRRAGGAGPRISLTWRAIKDSTPGSLITGIKRDANAGKA
ncbi:MAG: alpha-ketoglutarate-dependent dioxygenase AlkB [bacterium]